MDDISGRFSEGGVVAFSHALIESRELEMGVLYDADQYESRMLVKDDTESSLSLCNPDRSAQQPG